jgi:hypothetical protein
MHEAKPTGRTSRAASVVSFKSAVSTLHNQPGIIPGTSDVDGVRRSRFSRTLSMLEPHPKLQMLPTGGVLSDADYAEARRKHRGGSVSTFRSSFDDVRSVRSTKTAEHKKHTPEPSPRVADRSGSPFSIDYLSSQSALVMSACRCRPLIRRAVLPALVPSVSIGKDTRVQDEPPPLPSMHRNSFGVARTDSAHGYPGSQGHSRRRRPASRNWKQLSLPNIDRSAFTTFASTTAGTADDLGRTTSTDLQSKQAARRRSWKTKVETAVAPDETIPTPAKASNAPRHRVSQSLDETRPASRVKSTASLTFRPALAVAPEQEEEPTVAFGSPSPDRSRGRSPAPPPSASSSVWTGIDENAIEELDEAHQSRATSRTGTPLPFPRSPSPLSMHPLGTVIPLSTGSEDEGEEDDDDIPLSVLRTRTVSVSSYSTADSVSLRPVSVASTDSGHRLDTSRAESSITSLGFLNMLERGRALPCCRM